MTKEIVEAVGVLEREKGISADRLMAALEDAHLSAYKKTQGAAQSARVPRGRRTRLGPPGGGRQARPGPAGPQAPGRHREAAARVTVPQFGVRGATARPMRPDLS